MKWHTRAAENGQAGSQLELSKMYEQGKGIPQDNVYALMWRKIVASSGGPYVKEARETNALLEKLMKPPQIARAQKLAEECIRKKYKGCTK